MIIKKAFVTTSSFVITAALLSQIYSYSQSRFQTQKVNLEAFSKFAENIQAVSTAPIENVSAPDSVVNNDIIKVIDSEIAKKIKSNKFIVAKAFVKKKIVPKAFLDEAVKLELPVKIEIENFVINEEVLNNFEINNKGLINLHSFSNDTVEYSKFESMKLADNYDLEIKSLDTELTAELGNEYQAFMNETNDFKEDKKVASSESNVEYKDEVAVAQASTENISETTQDEVNTTQPAPTRVATGPSVIEKNVDDEMVMFDYSDKKTESVAPKTFDQKLYERPISNTVKQAISREIGNYPIKKLAPSTQNSNPLTKIDNQDIDLESDNNIIYDYSNDAAKKTVTTPKEIDAAVSAFAAPAKTSNTHYLIRAKEVNLNTHKLKQAYSFEFIPDYDRVERTDDHADGEISLDYSLAGNMNTLTGVVQTQGLIPTRVELNFEDSKGIEVPLINEEGIQLFLQKQSVQATGNLLMVALDSSIVDTEIDSRFAYRFFFDKNFRFLAGANGARYVMYAGVKTGNILIRYLLSNKESAQKIVFVGEGEMYFDNSKFNVSERETFTFTTRNLLGQKSKELVIDGGAISFFNTNITAKKKALNAYEIKVPTLVSGMRKYLEFKHLKDTIFVGSAGEKNIEIPSNDFIGKVLEMNDVSSLKERCVVQINLTKELSSLVANGKNRSGEMFVETNFIDKDGNFSRDLELADKVFVVGDMEGQFSVRLDYADQSTEFLKTFCSPGTYIVEQL